MAAQYYEASAINGNPRAQYEIGECYAFGRGVQQNYKLAALWFKKAADNDVADAQYALGICYELGVGVEKSSEYMNGTLGRLYKDMKKPRKRLSASQGRKCFAIK